MGSHVVWRDAALAKVKAAGATIIGEAADRLPNTLFMAVEGWDSPQQLITLDLSGVMVSAGSACSSGKVKPSKTVSAMGLNTLATGGVRVSGGWGTTEDDWARFAAAWVAAYDKHKARAAARVREVA
jgi:cysteine desulfurase